MSKRISVLFFSVVITILLITVSCKKSDNTVEPEDNSVSNGPIKTGTVVQVTTQNLGPSGGTIVISKPGTPVNGLTITVPQDGYSSTNTFSVSYAPITSNSLGANFNPVSPLITISNGGAFSNTPMTVKIPIKKASDEFALGFSYDATTGKLEAVPVIAADDSSVTLSTRHFGTSTSSAKIFGKTNDAVSMGTFVVSSIKESVLLGQTILNTGFTPGVDDWEFINYGSYTATGGHCAGQSMSAMWYYYEKKLRGEPGLFHRFDKVNNSSLPSLLWQDNPLGFRFASTIQRDFDWDYWITKVNVQSFIPSLTWKTFIAAMLITGDPQFVIIKKSGTTTGHAMIVYKISVADGKLYVADPNYPNNRGQDGTSSLRTISYSNGKFTPYDSFLKVGDPGVTFDQIAFFGKTANIDWAQITKRYSEIATKTIGNDRFPAYNLLMKQGNNFIAFNDGVVLNKDTLIMANKSNACSQAIAGTDNYQFIEAYDTTGNKLGSGDFTNKGITTIKLKAGANKLGLYIMGATGDVANRYIDFQWVTAYYTSLKIDPNPLSGEPAKEYKFTAQNKKSAPKFSKFIWTFGDNTSQVTVNNDSTVSHTYNNEGNYTVQVDMYDNNTNKKLATATSSAVIVKPSDLLKQLKTMNKLTEDCSFSYVNQVGYTTTEAFNVLAVTSKDSITWSGTSFTYSYQTLQDYSVNGSKANYYTTVSGQVAADAKSILEITYFYKVDYFEYYKASETQTRKMTFKNIPMTKYPGYQEWGSGTTYNYFVYEFDNAGSKANSTYLEYRWSLNPQFDIVGIDKIKNFSTPLKITFVRK